MAALFAVLALCLSAGSARASYTFSYNSGTLTATATGTAATDSLLLYAAGGEIYYSVDGGAASNNWGGSTVPAGAGTTVNIALSTNDGSSLTLGTNADPASTLLAHIAVIAPSNTTDAVVINDSGNATAQTYTVDTLPGTITGTGINYDQGASDAFEGGITLDGSSAGSTYNVASICCSSPSIKEPVNLVGGPGNDTFNVTTTSVNSPLSIDGGNPTPPAVPGDTLTITPAAQPLTVTLLPSGYQGTYAGNLDPVSFKDIETLTGFIPPVPAVPVPTLDAWELVMLAAVLAAVAVPWLRASRRRLSRRA